MYGTIQRIRLKEGAEPAYKALMDEFEARLVPGFMGHYMYHLDADPSLYAADLATAQRGTGTASADVRVLLWACHTERRPRGGRSESDGRDAALRASG
jgi:hypothetical protein